MAVLIDPSEKETSKKAIHKSLSTLGTDPHADIRLHGAHIPPVAAHIVRQNQTYTIVASQAQMPIFLNDKPIVKQKLSDRDVIRIANARLVFYVNEPAPETKSDHHEEKSRDLKAYQRLLEFSKRLGEETEIPTLLEALMDEIIALTNAEKGFLLLFEENQPKVKVARNLHRETLDQSVEELSDSILRKVFESKLPVVVSNALDDQEFKSSLSVINFRLSSVMCVPLLHQGNLFGAIYVGNNSFVSAFDDQSLEMLTVFASQAALLVQHAFKVSALKQQTKSLKASLEATKFGGIIGACSGMQQVFRQIDKIAQTNVSVLILGETGTGKELIARELHQRSPRCKGPFVVINCGAIPESLLESELFGHVKGAFTGATQNRDGRFQAAHGGTLFLDEIGEMPLHLQVKMLRVLQDHRVTRVGDNKSEEVDIRVVAATNRNLAELVKENAFRDDLYYRLNVVQIDVPALRDRGNDILVIASFLLQKYAELYEKDIHGLTEAAQNTLLNFNWPGNVRQLENRIRRAIVMCDSDRIRPSDLDLPTKETDQEIIPLATAIERYRLQYIQNALDRNAGNRTKTARELGVDPRTIFRHLEEQKRSGEAHA